MAAALHVTDMIVCATGFYLDFPFLPKGLVPIADNVAPLYFGALLPDYRHLYITAAIHPIYGFGPLVSMGRSAARMIQIQDRIELPLGRVVQCFGRTTKKSHLVHPGTALGKCAGRAGFCRWSLPSSRREAPAAKSCGKPRLLASRRSPIPSSRI